MKFFIKDFSSKYDQIRSFPQIWSHLLEKSLKENFIFCAVYAPREAVAHQPILLRIDSLFFQKSYKR